MGKAELYKTIADEAALIASRKVARKIKQPLSTRIFKGTYRDRSGKVKFTLSPLTLFETAPMPDNVADIMEAALEESVNKHLEEMIAIRVGEAFGAVSS